MTAKQFTKELKLQMGLDVLSADTIFSLAEINGIKTSYEYCQMISQEMIRRFDATINE